jgi:hypothetical protein
VHLNQVIPAQRVTSQPGLIDTHCIWPEQMCGKEMDGIFRR